MAFAFQRRRGTTTAHSTFTGLAGELTVDTTKNTVVVHDGSTAGGIPLSKQRATTGTTSGTTYTLALADANNIVTTTSASGVTITVPASVFTAPYGQAVTIFNNSSSNQTITSGSGVTMYMAGTANTGNRTLAQRGLATVVCVTANTFVISGAGVT